MKQCIVIGSGAGGLSTAVILAKHGYDVTVLEQGAVAGGCLQSFVRKGTLFETGMHILGSLEEGHDLRELLSYLEVLYDLPLSPLDKDCYQTVRIGDDEYRFGMGREAFVDSMSEYFPEERKAIEYYAEEVERIRRASSIVEIMKGTAPMHDECLQGTIGEVMDKITKNRRLQDVLCGGQPLYAGLRDKTTFELLARLHAFYNSGTYRVIGGSQQICDRMIDVLKHYGGKLYLSRNVTRILTDGTQATGVETADGEVWNADLVVSTIHPQRLMPMLQDCKMIRPVYRHRIMNIPNTPSVFALFVKFKDGKMPYLNHTCFVHKTGTPWDAMTYDWDKWPGTYMYMHSCKEDGQKWADGGVVFSYMTMEQCAKWSDTRIEHRGDDYKAFKKQHAERVIASVDQDYPGFAESIDDYWTGTPLTYRDYCGLPDGTMYGVVHEFGSEPEQHVSARTKIPNLFIAGQNIVNHGLQGVLVGSVVATSHILGYNPLVQR